MPALSFSKNKAQLGKSLFCEANGQTNVSFKRERENNDFTFYYEIRKLLQNYNLL